MQSYIGYVETPLLLLFIWRSTSSGTFFFFFQVHACTLKRSSRALRIAPLKQFLFFLAFLISLFFFYCCLLCIFEKSYDQRTFFLPLTWYTKKSVLDFLFKIGYCALFSVVLFYERYRVYSPMNEEKKAPFFVCFDMCYLCCFHLCAVGCTVRFSFFFVSTFCSFVTLLSSNTKAISILMQIQKKKKRKKSYYVRRHCVDTDNKAFALKRKAHTHTHKKKKRSE